MVSHSYGPAFNCLRDHALVEPAPRRTRSCVAHWVLCDRVWNPRDHSGLPLAQLTYVACALVSRTFAFYRRLARTRPVVRVIPSERAFFARPNAVAGVFLKKMRPDAIGVAIILRRWHMYRLILRVEFATAKRRPSS